MLKRYPNSSILLGREKFEKLKRIMQGVGYGALVEIYCISAPSDKIKVIKNLNYTIIPYAKRNK